MEHAGEDLSYLDPVTQERFIPYCIEPSLGADRITLAFLLDVWEEQELEPGDVRIVLHLHSTWATNPIRRPCFHFPKGCRRERIKYIGMYQSISWWTMTNRARLEALSAA